MQSVVIIVLSAISLVLAYLLWQSKHVTPASPHPAAIEESAKAHTLDLEAENLRLQTTITEQQQALTSLRESEAHFRLLAENARDAIFRYDLLPEPRLSYVSPAATRLTGYTADEHFANAALWLELVHEDDRERVVAALTRWTTEQDPLELRWRRKDGSFIWYEWRFVPICDDQGECVTVLGTSRDITTRRIIEEDLRKLSRAVEQSSVAITITDLEGRIEYVNPKFTQTSGFNIDDVRGQTPRILHPANAHRPEAKQFRDTLQNRGEWRGELHNVTKDGKPYWEAGVISPIYDINGKATHFLAVMEDITQHKQQERERSAILAVSLALRAANDREEMVSIVLREIVTTFDAIKAFFIVPDSATNEMVVHSMFENGEFQTNLNVRIASGKGVAARVMRTRQPYVTENAIGDPDIAVPQMFGEARAVALVPLISNEMIVGLFSVARLTPYSESDVRVLLALADMAATGLLRATYHEATTRHAINLEREVAERTHEVREAYERLQELDVLKSKFVSDVSHELRTPVTNIGLYLKLIERKPERQAHYFEVLREEAQRLESLVVDILDLTQLDSKPALALSPIDLNAMLVGVVAAHQAAAERRNLHLSLIPGEGLPIFMGDIHKLQQVTNNLIANAINYTPAGFVKVHAWVHDAVSISFSVEDSGTGIYAEDIPHLFDRFYRGRRDQIVDVPGTGLGLSIVQELVHLHNGSIQIDSEVGRGSTFMVTLPTTSRTAS